MRGRLRAKGIFSADVCRRWRPAVWECARRHGAVLGRCGNHNRTARDHTLDAWSRVVYTRRIIACNDIVLYVGIIIPPRGSPCIVDRGSPFDRNTGAVLKRGRHLPGRGLRRSLEHLRCSLQGQAIHGAGAPGPQPPLYSDRVIH